MNQLQKGGTLHVENVNLWAHVGVLEKERLMGQDFLLDLSVSTDISDVIKSDTLSSAVDYSVAIQGVQQLAFNSRANTLEAFSEEILDYLSNLYGEVSIKIKLTKCNPPIPGFTGTVSIQRSRNYI